MNQSKIKDYAPRARRDFIAAVTNRAATFGLARNETVPIVEQGEVVLIGGAAFPRAVARKRTKLERRIQQPGFDHVMEAMAYTWFNRFMAIRYMELHGYLDHGYRVLSHPEGSSTPEIVEQAEDLDLPGLDNDEIVDLKLDGTREEELYRKLLIAQCNALNRAMPFLFESVDDETELLLPDNLLHSDSLIRKLVEEIPEEDWQSIEIIGWLYQFYISEKKDQVIGKVVKSEDIPAATQLFTPNWIVKYMVQNSLGAQWLATYPDSPLKGQMEYYIEPAEQTEEIQAELEAITPKSLNPEELTLMDPACGSGHILVEAYDLFKAIYLERGYSQRDVPKLILEKNLFGLDIDERAAQLTGFALMMKGRADDRRLFERSVKLNVMALVDSAGFDAEELPKGVELGVYGVQPSDLTELKRLFEHATTFGSLIQVPDRLASKLPALKKLSETTSQGLFVAGALTRLAPLVQQALLLAAQYDTVVANPPYIGSKFHIPVLKRFLRDHYEDYKKDVFSAFIDRNLAFGRPNGRLGFMSPFVWMFISSYEHLRTRLINAETITSLVQLEYSGFEGATVPICTFTLQKGHVTGQRGCYVRLSDFRGSDNQGPKTREAVRDRDCGWFFESAQDEFKKIPGSPLAYWVSESLTATFAQFPALEETGETLQGMTTCDNDFYIRHWWEVDREGIRLGAASREEAMESGRKWYPYTKGGAYRKWAGNSDFVVNWEDDGALLQSRRHPKEDKVWAHNFNLDHIFREGASYSSLSSGTLALRYTPSGFLFDQKGSMVFADSTDLRGLLALMNSRLAMSWLEALCPTLDFNPGALLKIPVDPKVTCDATLVSNVDIAVASATADWDAYETGIGFVKNALVCRGREHLIERAYLSILGANRNTIAEMKRLEEENNRLFIGAYGLGDELTPDVPIEQITLTVNPAYRYGKEVDSGQWTVDRGFGEELEGRFRQDTMKELASYAIGCMMGRYRLDRPGLIYAHSGNEDFWEIYEREVASDQWLVASEEQRHKSPHQDEQNSPRPGQDASGTAANTSHSPLATSHHVFPPDEDGIIPLTGYPWFDDDAAHRLIEFISVAWDEAHLEENLTFLADNLSPKKNESSRETIRRYLCDKFFKDHLQTYKKRPIYWLFSSGKQKAFQCLVYLHRYKEGTLARMRTEYVIPLQGLVASRIDQLDGDIPVASSTSHRRKLEKERDALVKHRAELQEFDEKLRHYADQRISLDLDDGVKVNYGKFGDLLAEVKAVHGKKPEVT